MSEPLVSVVVPVYNVESFLKECVKSICNQSYKNIEILLIDDGSTDKSGKLCEDLATNDSRIKVYHKTNGGLSDARNYGIERANGEYITFIDSDDYIQNYYVSELLDECLENNTDISIGSHIIKFENSENYKGLGENVKKVFSQKETLTHMLLDDGVDLSAWAKLYRTSLFEQIRYPVGQVFEDTATTYKLIYKCQQISYTGKPVYFYRIRNNSITTSASFEKKYQLITQTKNMCNDVVSKYPDLTEAANRRLVWAYFSTLNQLIKCPQINNFKSEKNEILTFLKENKKNILRKTEYTKRDKLAMLSLSLGLSFYKFSWNLYSKLFK